MSRCLSCGVALFLLGLHAGPAPAQQEVQQPTIPFDGPEVFSYLLKARGFKAIPSIDQLKKYPYSETLVIVFGEPTRIDPLRQLIGDLRAFQVHGGSVMLASDYTVGLPEFGVQITGTVAHERDGPLYKDNPLCPVIKSLEQNAPDFRLSANGIATNRPSYFTNVSAPAGQPPPLLKPLAGFQTWHQTWIMKAPTPNRAKAIKLSLVQPDGRFLLPYAYIADKSADARGRALLIAGNGSFTNGMLLQPDTDNFRFAAQCLDWLSKGPSGAPRKRALFIVGNEVIKSFDVDLKPPPLPVPPVPIPTMAVVNRLLHGIEEEGILFRILEDGPDVRIAVRIGLVMLTLLLLCYGAKKLTEQRHHTERGSALLAGPYAVPPDTSPLVAQRMRLQIERNGLGAEARALVRAWFLEACAIPIADWEHIPSRPAPAAQLAGGWWERQRVHRELARLARLAGSTMAASFSWPDMVRLTRTLQSLSAAVEQGRLRFTGCSPGENS